VDDTRDNGARDQPGAAGGEENFLSRWSRRKQADRKDETLAAPRPAATATGKSPRDAAPAIAGDLRQELTDADMPPLASLDSDSDFSLFMSPGVSEQLRTQALRKLFHLPAFNVTDGPNDYDEDYTQFAGLGTVVTQEMKRVLKRELEAEVAREAVPVAETEASVESADANLTAELDEGSADESSRSQDGESASSGHGLDFAGRQ